MNDSRTIPASTRESIGEILREYRQGLKKIFRDQLIEVILYGSYARGDQHEYSDIDVLCILREPFGYVEAIKKTSRLTAELNLKHDVLLSRAFASENDFRTRQLPFFMNVRKEGIAF